MKAWMRSGREIGWLSAIALLVVLAVNVNRGQALPEEFPECAGQTPDANTIPLPGEPPMVDRTIPAQTTPSPRPPFTPPFPTPLPPEQAGPPFAPGMPFVPAQPREQLPEPVVRLRVLAPARIEPGKEIEYRLTVENVSQAEAHHVLVRDRLPRGMEEQFRAEPKPTRQAKVKDGLTDLLWELGTLKAGEHKVIVLTIKPTGTDEVRNSAYVQFEHGQTVKTEIAKPGLRLKTTAPAQAILYESIPFRIEITNTGTATLRDVVLTDELPADLEFAGGKPEPSGEKPLTWKVGDVAPGQTRRIEYQAISRKTGKFSNKAKATAAGDISATDAATVVVGEAKLKVTTSGPARRSVRRPIPYHITVRNLGSVPLTNVQVSDEIPRVPRGPGFELLHASQGGRLERGFVNWSLGVLPPGERRSLLVVLRAPASGWCWNAVSVRAENNVSEKATSGATRIEDVACPVLEIDKSTDTLDVGEKANYKIRLFNAGKSNVLAPSVVVAVPDEMSILGQRGATTGQREGQTIRFAPVDVLARNEEKEYTIDIEAKKPGTALVRSSWTDTRKVPTAPSIWWEDSTTILGPIPPPTKEPNRAKEAYEVENFSRQQRIASPTSELRLGP